MLPPHELKNKAFSKAMRGYNPVEVDEYIEFLISKYTELYRENDELERKLKAAITRLDEMRNDEDSIRSTLIDAKRAAGKIKAEAEERADAIVRSAKASCNTILRDFNEKIDIGRDTIAELQRDAFTLKQELFERYSEHIRFIEKLTEGFDEASIPEPTELRREAVNAIKSSISITYQGSESGIKNRDEPSVTSAPVTFTAPGTTASEQSSNTEMDISETDMVPFPDADGDDINDTHVYTSTDMADALTEAAFESEAVPVTRSKLIVPSPSGKSGLKDSVRELGKAYKEADEIINTPDSDITDEMSYLDFVKAVTGNPSAEDKKKEADLDFLFDDGNKKKRKK